MATVSSALMINPHASAVISSVPPLVMISRASPASSSPSWATLSPAWRFAPCHATIASLLMMRSISGIQICSRCSTRDLRREHGRPRGGIVARQPAERLDRGDRPRAQHREACRFVTDRRHISYRG